MNISTTIYKKILLAFVFVLLVPSTAFASQTNGTIISGGNAGYAWSNQAGWINFDTTNGNINITDSGITGYAWNANYGWINMNPTNGGVHISANGTLSGYAWGQSFGWVNFSGASITSTGKFSGQATGATIGTLTFNCTNCNVATDYRPKDYRTTTTKTQTSPGSISPILLTSGVPATVITAEPTTQPRSAQKGNNSTKNSTVGKTNLTSITTILPTKIFNTHLLLNKITVTTVKDLVANVIFNSSKKTPTHVLMTFSIRNSNGDVVWSNKATTTIQKRFIYTKHFLNVQKLPAGLYMLKLHTKYDGNSNRFLTKQFTITPTSINWFSLFIGGLGLLFIFLIFLIVKRKIS